MSDAIDWDALFPGANKQENGKADEPNYAPLIDMYRSVGAQLTRDGATPEEVPILTRMIVEPFIVAGIMQNLRGGQ